MAKIIAYSDIHHHQFSNGLTGDDVEAVENEFTDLLVSTGADIWVFGGDRFLSRNALDVSRKRADTCLRKRAEINPQYQPGIMLVGNHDRWSTNYSGHNLYVVGLHKIEGVTVLDTISQHTEYTTDGTTITFTAIPAGHKVPVSGLVPNPEADFNVILFHDIIKGCRYANGIVAPEGVDAGLLDLPGFDLVLGGDNHQRQVLDFKNTTGLYIGAPLQHNWGDVDSERGFLIVDLIKGQPVKYRWANSKAPIFLKEEHRIENSEQLVGVLSTIGDRWINNIIKLTLSGPPAALNGLDMPRLQEKFLKTTRARQVKISTKYDEAKIEILDYIGTVRDDSQEWRSFIDLKKSELSGLDISKIEQLGIKFINEVDDASNS